MGEAPVPKGFRRDITVLHHLSDLMEKHPELPRPTVNFRMDREGVRDNTIMWSLTPNYTLKVPWEDADGNYFDWDKRDALAKELRRVDLEERMAALVLALGKDVEWEKNDPTVDSFSYTLTTTWHGCKLTISTWREAVCEEVVVLETEREEEQPDPEVVEKLMAEVPKVKVKVTDKITEWQCNERLAAVTAPKLVRTVQALT